MKKIALLLALAGCLLAAPSVRKWEVFEIETAVEPSRAVFEGPGGMAYTIAAFSDGEHKWKVRFAPPAAGEWSYTAGELKGTFQCVENPARHGFVQVAKSGRYFEYSDGTPFLWIGDTWWNWSKKGIHFETFKKLVDDRAAKGFTVGQLFLPGNSQPDFEQLRRVDEMIAYANSRGITVWIHGWWGGKDLAQKIGPERIREWWRYLIHRLGAYNVIWVLAGEYNMYNYSGLGLQFWKDLGAMVRKEDPYRRLISVHPTPPGWAGGAEAPQWSTGEVLHREPWLDYNQSQVGHSKWRNEMIPSIVAADYARTPPKPVVVTEPWYEFIDGAPAAEDIRFGAWSAILSGAAGHTYGGGHVWWAHVPEAPTNQGSWPLHKEFDTDTLDYPGALSISYMAKFLQSIEWWKLEPHPELISDYPAKFCRAVPGREYVAFLRWGGTVKLDLRPSSTEDVFQYSWLDLAERKETNAARIPGGSIREFRTPEDYPRYLHYKDWVLHVRR